jgi:hypothetical protein
MENTPTILINVVSEEDGEPNFELGYCSPGQSYRSKRSPRAIISEFEGFDDEKARVCEDLAESYQVFSQVGFGEERFIIAAINEIISYFEEGEEHENLDALLEEVQETDNLKRRRIEESDDQNMEEVMSVQSAPKAGVGSAIAAPATVIAAPVVIPTDPPNFLADTPESILLLISTIDPAIKYLGFDAKKVRKEFLSNRLDNNIAARDLIVIFAGYAHVGNNASKLNTKRVDVNISRGVMQKLTEMNVLKKAAKAEDMTLARAGIAFMPEYLLYRRFLTEGLQDQTDSEIEAVYKDICFYGCSQIRNKTGYETFHKEFSTYIYEPKEETALDDKKFLSSYNKWNKVAIKGYKTDQIIDGKMTAALSAGSESAKSVIFDMIMENLQIYRNQP